MRTKSEPKKANWHPADIIAALRKAGWSLRRLSQAHGYHPDALKHALHRPYPKAEGMIADAIGVAPQTVWPTRYTTDGKPNRSRVKFTHKGKRNKQEMRDEEKQSE